MLAEISSLHDQMYEIQTRKDAELKQQKEKYEKELSLQTMQIKKSGEEGTQIRELQIKKLKETVELREFQIEALNNKVRNQNSKISSENESLKQEIKHFQQLKEIEIKEISSRARDTISSTVKQFERDKAIEISHYESSIKKLKKEINNKNLDIEQLSKQSSIIQEEAQGQILAAKSEKEQLLEELREVEEQYSLTIKSEKKRVAQLAEMEKENMQNIL